MLEFSEGKKLLRNTEMMKATNDVSEIEEGSELRKAQKGY